MTKKPLLYIEFLDHGSAAGWLDDGAVDLVANTVIFNAVGWWVAENKKVLCLGSFRDGESSHARQYIIKACITKRRVLKIPR